MWVKWIVRVCVCTEWQYELREVIKNDVASKVAPMTWELKQWCLTEESKPLTYFRHLPFPVISTLWHNDAIYAQASWSTLGEAMDYGPLDTKPLSKPMLTYCQLDTLNCNFYQENAFENVFCEMTVILFRPQCVNNRGFTPHTACNLLPTHHLLHHIHTFTNMRYAARSLILCRILQECEIILIFTGRFRA